MIRADIGNRTEWVLCGSLCSWGDPLQDEFTLAVFLYLDPTVRMRRLKQREQERYGARIEPGGDMHQQHCDFMTWAASYDSAKAPTRSFDLHYAWMQQLACPILKLDSSASTQALLSATIIKQQSQIGSKD